MAEFNKKKIQNYCEKKRRPLHEILDGPGRDASECLFSDSPVKNPEYYEHVDEKSFLGNQN